MATVKGVVKGIGKGAAGFVTSGWGGLAMAAASPLLAGLAPKQMTPEQIMARMYGQFDKQMTPARHGLFAAEAGAAASMRQNLASMMMNSGAGGSGMGMASTALADSSFGTSMARSENQYRGMLSNMVAQAMSGPAGSSEAWAQPGAGHKMLGGYAQLFSSPDFMKMLQAVLDKKGGDTGAK